MLLLFHGRRWRRRWLLLLLLLSITSILRQLQRVGPVSKLLVKLLLLLLLLMRGSPSSSLVLDVVVLVVVRVDAVALDDGVGAGARGIRLLSLHRDHLLIG